MTVEEILLLVSIAILVVSVYLLYNNLKMYRKALFLLKMRAEDEVLAKTGKLRKRYIVFAVISQTRYSKKDLSEAIRTTFKHLFGEAILVKADPYIVYYDPGVMRGVIRVSHIYKNHVLAVLSLIPRITGLDALIIPLKTTGTIKKARKILYKHRRELQL